MLAVWLIDTGVVPMTVAFLSLSTHASAFVLMFAQKWSRYATINRCPTARQVIE